VGVAVSAPIQWARVQLGRRYRQFRELWIEEGSTGIAKRVRRTMADRLAPKSVLMPVCRADVIAADLSRPFLPPIPKITHGQPLNVNWVIVPQGAGAGGATTVFRIIRYLEAHGHSNRVYFYNVFRADHRYYESIIRDFYGFHGPVVSLDEEMEEAHAVVATSWPTAYPVFNSRCSGKRFYFVQDFEPYFYPSGALSVLAENTYRMGFHAITIGDCFSQKLRNEFGMPVDSFEYGCDTSRYCCLPGVRRTGVVFYARPEAPRRGVELGLMALEVFANRCPGIDIHLYGTKMGKQPFRCVDHGRVSPEKLNHLYNRCFAGLSLSMTNVTLVAYEMLAAGCIPVVNDTINIRTDLKNHFVRYALPEPHALASELEAVVLRQDFESLSRAAAKSVRSVKWDDAGSAVDAILRRALEANGNVPVPHASTATA
jgi:glycosyltransferase involved in cell wall biosynthesis